MIIFDNKKLIIFFTIVIIIASIIVMFGVPFFKSFSQEKFNTVNYPSFQKNIKPLFRPIDIQSMRWKFDLSQYNDVKKYSQSIYNAIKSGSMPCDAPWNKDKVALFKKWMDNGFQK